jgi:proteic killer suppression protein
VNGAPGVRVQRVNVDFKNKKLERCYRESRLAIREWGHEVAERYIQRVNIMKKSDSVDELMKIKVLDCHPLKGDRQGQWAIKLTGFYRLIFRAKDGGAVVEEVSKHYDD